MYQKKILINQYIKPNFLIFSCETDIRNDSTTKFSERKPSIVFSTQENQKIKGTLILSFIFIDTKVYVTFKRITIKYTIMFQTIQMIDNKDMFHLSLKGHKQVASFLLIYFSIEYRIHEYFQRRIKY